MASEISSKVRCGFVIENSVVGSRSRFLPRNPNLRRRLLTLLTVCRFIIRSQGKGEPALVFIHCWGCNRNFWDNQVAEFSKTYRVVTIDLPGHGESGREGKTGLSRVMATTSKQSSRSSDLKRVVLVGSSMGGPIALEATKTHARQRRGDRSGRQLAKCRTDITPEQLDGVFKQMTG